MRGHPEFVVDFHQYAEDMQPDLSFSYSAVEAADSRALPGLSYGLDEGKQTEVEF